MTWLLLLTVIPIVCFYLLKVRPRQIAVASTLFWQQVLNEHKTKRLWRKLRYPLSLLLSLLFILLLTLAVRSGGPSETGWCIIIIDNSLSMLALVNGKTTRLEVAKQQIRVAGFPAQHTAILTGTESQPVVCGFTGQRGQLYRAIDSIQPAADVSMTNTLKLAQELAADKPDAKIIIYTDGNDEISRVLTPAERNGNLPETIFIGEPADNTAITQFQPRRIFNSATDYEILLTVENFGKKTVETQIEIEQKIEEQNTERSGISRWQPVDVIPVTLEPNKPVTKMITGLSMLQTTFRAILPVNDVLPDDNTATATLPECPKRVVYYYGTDNFFLLNALESQPNVEIQRVKTIPKDMPEHGILLIHQTVPADLPAVRCWIIDPCNDCNLFTVGDIIQNPLAGIVDKNSPLLASVKLQDSVLHGARELKIAQQIPAQTIVKSITADTPLFCRIGSVFVLSANISAGDFALQTSFPILVANVLNADRGREAEDGLHHPQSSCSESDLYANNNGISPTSGRYFADRILPYFVFWCGLAIVLLVLDWIGYQRRIVE